jgi:hypothetical protein
MNILKQSTWIRFRKYKISIKGFDVKSQVFFTYFIYLFFTMRSKSLAKRARQNLIKFGEKSAAWLFPLSP